jgi:hypothetical protein
VLLDPAGVELTWPTKPVICRAVDATALQLGVVFNRQPNTTMPATA